MGMYLYICVKKDSVGKRKDFRYQKHLGLGL